MISHTPVVLVRTPSYPINVLIGKEAKIMYVYTHAKGYH